MGDEILKIFRLFFLFTCIGSYAFSNENIAHEKMKTFDNLFELINQKRSGLLEKSISKTQNPFISNFHIKIDEKNKTNKMTKNHYKLNAIFDNRVHINNRWYVINEKIGTYTLTYIKNSSVILKNLDNEVELKLYKRNKNVAISHQ